MTPSEYMASNPYGVKSIIGLSEPKVHYLCFARRQESDASSSNLNMFNEIAFLLLAEKNYFAVVTLNRGRFFRRFGATRLDQRSFAFDRHFLTLSCRTVQTSSPDLTVKGTSESNHQSR